MRRNLDNTDQSMRMAVGGAIISLGLLSRKWWTILGLYPYITGSMKYCPLKNFFEVWDQKLMEKSEANYQPVEAEEGSGGYRTGNPASGKVTTENPMNIHDA